MDNAPHIRTKRERGITVLLVVVFMGVFGMVVATLASYIFTQASVSRSKLAREAALHVSEAGLEYYRWFLAHNPGNLTNGTGLSGPYNYEVKDPEGAVMGDASISVIGNSACGVVQSIDITSEGSARADARFKRTLTARYARPSIAEYSNMINTNVWAGADRNIVGPYHSNGGIRMDGTNNSDVTSAVSTWLCTGSFGCSPSQNRNGVWGAGSGSALWQYPVPQFNFSGIASNFATLKTYAQAQGLYFAPVAGGDQRGYRIVFNSNGTITVYRVTGTSAVWSQHVDNIGTWVQDYHTITTQTLVGTYAIPDGCPVIFVESKAWIEGTVAKKVTLVAADIGAYTPDIVLNNNLTYTTNDGSVGLTAIAERSVLVPLVSPDVMTIRGIFIAQSGYVGRNYYQQGGTYGVPSAYNSYVIQSSLTTIGTVVSNQRVGTQWNCGGSICSGYQSRTDAYDRVLAFSPPPFTPAASSDYSFILWKED